MSVPFSNTNLRIPRGFANILEGLAREVLREQPEDIPTFAAVYFATLLKQREESGLDPAEWGARLEDRFYNNRAFKDTTNQGNSSSAKVTGSSVNEDKADELEFFENGAKVTHPSQRTSPSFEGPDASKDVENQEAHQSNELDSKLDDESVKTDPIANPMISYRGTADVDAEELEGTEETKEQDTGEKRTAGTADICSSELEPTPASSYRGLADVDVCAEELQTTSQEDEPADEDTEGSRYLIDASLAGVSESSLLGLGEDISGSQDVLDTYDKLMLSSTESPAYAEQEASKELNDTSDNERPVVLPMEEEEEIDDLSEYAQNTLSEMTDALFEDEGENSHVEQFSLNEAAQSIAIPVSFETSTEEEFENQESKDTLLETQAMREPLSTLEKISLEDSSNNASGEVEHFLNIASEAEEEEEEDDDICVKQSKVTDEGGLSPNYHQSSFEVQEEDKQIGSSDMDIFETSRDAQMEESKGLMDSHTSFSGTSEDMKEVDTTISQQDLPEVEETNVNDDQGEAEMKEDYVIDVLAIHEAEDAAHSLTSEEPRETTDVIQEGHAAEREDTETAIDQEEQSEQKSFSQNFIPESEDMEVENPGDKNDQQEECSHPQEEEDIMDIPLDDPEANKAAAKIQAGFRGHMTRKKLKPGDKPGEEVSSSGEALNGSQGDTAGGSEGVETDDTSVPEQ